MRRKRGQFGMTLMEVLVALATVLVLIGALMGIGSYVRTRAKVDLTESMLGVLTTALEQYYDVYSDFPFDTPDTNANGLLGDDYVDGDLIADIDPSGSGTISSVLPSHTSAEAVADPISSASSVALFYFLDKEPTSRAIAGSIVNSLVTNKDDNGTDIQITLNTVPPKIIDLPRYIDAWETSIRYKYLDGTAFPTLTSAGPDKIFDTPDDVTSQ